MSRKRLLELKHPTFGLHGNEAIDGVGNRGIVTRREFHSIIEPSTQLIVIQEVFANPSTEIDEAYA